MNCRKCRAPIPDGSRFCNMCGAKQDMAHKPKSRGNGTGSVYKLPNGSWIAVKILSWTVDADGKKHKNTVSKSGFRTKKEALEYLPKLSSEEKAERKKSITFKQLFDKWIPTHKKSKSTLDCYRAAMNHFRPVWNESMNEITVDDLQECMDECPAGKRTMENMKALCGLLYKYGIPRNYASLNMGQYLIVNGEAGAGKEGLPLQALSKLSQSVGKVPYANYIVAQCYLGFRPSELLALEIKDYNRTDKTLTGGSKTEAGRNRVVTISPKIQPIIDQLTKNRISGYIFCGKTGGHFDLNDYREKFYEALEACGIDNPTETANGVPRKKYTPHSCRHTFSTLMKKVPGADKDKLSLIGHTSTEMLRHYQDVDLEGLRKITDAI